MHGFFGCAQDEPSQADPCLQWMRQWFGLAPRQESAETTRAPLRYLTSLRGADAPTAESEGLWLAHDGFIAADQFRQADGAEPATPSQLARALLERYVDQGPQALAALNGRYVVAVWDARRKRLELINDALGLKPVFLWRRGGLFAFSSNLWAIACHPEFSAEVDPQGVAEMLLFSYQQKNRTLWRDVSVLPPGSVTAFAGGELTSQVVRNLKFSDERWNWPLDDVADGMYALLSRSVKRRLPHGQRFLLPLTGGFDSRTLLGLLRENSNPVQAVTQRNAGLWGDDARFARKVARRAGVEHEFVPIPYDFLARFRRKTVAINGGTYDIHTGRILSLISRAPGGDLPVVSGNLGGELSGGHATPQTLPAMPEQEFQWVFGRASDACWTPEQLQAGLGPQVPADVLPQVERDAREFYTSVPGPFFHRLHNWILLLTRRRHISYQLFYYEQSRVVHAPFYDMDYVDFICSLPLMAVEQRLAYRRMIARHVPDLAQIPSTGGPLDTSFRSVLNDFVNTQRTRVMESRLAGKLSGKIWSDSMPLHYARALRTESAAVIDHLRESTDRLSPLLDAGWLRGQLDSFVGGDNSAALGMLNLSALATAMEMVEDPAKALTAWAEGEGGA